MNGRAFKLGTFAKPDGKPFAAIVLDDTAVHLAQAHEAYRGSGRRALSTTANSPGLSIQDLLGDWDANFAALQEIVAFLDKDGAKESARRRPAVASLTALPPVARPGKMFYAAQNFQEHVDEMIRAGMSPTTGPKFTGEKSTTAALPVPEGAELPRRRQRRHRDPERRQEGRLGGRDRLRHRQARQAHQGRARARSRRRLDDHQRRLRPRPADPHRPAGAALGLAERQEPRQVRADGAVSGAARLRAETT